MVFKPNLQEARVHRDAAFPEKGSGFILRQCLFDNILQDLNQLFGPHQEITGVIQHTSNISD